MRLPLHSWLGRVRQYFLLRYERGEVDCKDFERGDEHRMALCQGTGHYLCRECRWLNKANSEMI